MSRRSRSACSHPGWRKAASLPIPLYTAGRVNGHWWNGDDLLQEDERTREAWVETRRRVYLEGLRDEAIVTRKTPCSAALFPVEEVAAALTGFYRDPAYIRIPVLVAFHLIGAAVPSDETSSKVSKKLRATAFHEAGHAVEAFYLGIAFRHVTIEPVFDGQTEIESLGHVRFRNWPDWANPDSGEYMESRARRWFEKRVRIDLAGQIAQTKGTGEPAPVWMCYSDYHHAVSTALALSGWRRKEAEVWAERLFVETENHLSLDHVWRGVEALASALLCERTIKSRAARQMIKSQCSG